MPYHKNILNKDRLMVAFVMLMAGVFIALAITGGVLGYSPVPYWDMWGYLRLDRALHSGSVTQLAHELWIPHNEHRTPEKQDSVGFIHTEAPALSNAESGFIF